ncbi:hypothetical protein D3C76_1247080 [compost metagenome]
MGLGHCPAPARRTAGQTRSASLRHAWRYLPGTSGLQRPSPAGAQGVQHPHVRGFRAAHDGPHLPEPPGHSLPARHANLPAKLPVVNLPDRTLAAAGRPVNQSRSSPALQRCQKKGLSWGFPLVCKKSKAQHNSAAMPGKILCGE